MIILGIETSCDETAAAVVETSEKEEVLVRSNIVSSQVKLHAKRGGVVPNLAAREHLKNIIPVIEASLKEAGVPPQQVDVIAVTQGPGLIPALLIGVNTAKTLSYVWKKPLLGIHHIEGHIYANFIGENLKSEILSRVLGTKQEEIKFPVLCLVVSGGHTQLVFMKEHLSYEIIGETQDDAAGEAFDKVARILGLGYPGGPRISIQADEFKKRNTASTITLPRPMINTSDLNFSFSGLKTAVLYLTKKNIRKMRQKKFIQEVSHEFQQSVIDVLVSKTIRATKEYAPKTVMLAGGVSANKELRAQFERAIKEHTPHARCVMLAAQYSGDNAAMIATAGAYRWQHMNEKQRKSYYNSWKNLQADANLILPS